MSAKKKRPIRVLSIGPSHIIALNRSAFRELANNEEFAITVVAPNKFKGDLRPLSLEREPEGSRLNLIGIDAVSTGSIHLFTYDQKQLNQVMSEQVYDLVYIWAEPFSMSCYQVINACSQDKKICLFTAQNINKEYPFPLDEIERAAVSRAARWIGVGNLVFQTMIERNYPMDKGRIIPLPVDASIFRPLTPAEKAEVIKELKLKPPVIGFLGRLTEEKGIDVLLSAFDQIDPALDWSALFIGSGEYRSKILSWARERGLSSRVKVKLLAHSEVPRYLAAMQVLAAPSQTRDHWKEQFG
ncbi:MAG TPA: glycosyltransferase, partial [Blastocatellia bacterium]|nr:glycosyltransferase [Blastocatellia bacterium]